MHLATVTAEALAGLPAIDAGMADWPSGCTVERERLIAASVLALLLLLAAWWPLVPVGVLVAAMWKAVSSMTRSRRRANRRPRGNGRPP